MLVILETILLAEDNEHDAVFFQGQLKQAKILNPLRVVTDGAETIDYLNGNGPYADRFLFPLPSVLFLDLRMPKISGQQVLTFLNSPVALHKMPVIVLSVLGELKDVHDAYQRGALSFLVKPVSAIDILEALRAIPFLTFERENESWIMRRNDRPIFFPTTAPDPSKPIDPMQRAPET